MILSVFTLFDALRLTVVSTIRPTTPTAAARVFPVTGTGPQLWYGEMVSYGSRTETRYGRPGAPNASESDWVQPPVLEENRVRATSSFQSSTCPAVSSTACLPAGVSAETPR